MSCCGAEALAAPSEAGRRTASPPDDLAHDLPRSREIVMHLRPKPEKVRPGPVLARNGQAWKQLSPARGCPRRLYDFIQFVKRPFNISIPLAQEGKCGVGARTKEVARCVPDDPFEFRSQVARVFKLPARFCWPGRVTAKGSRRARPLSALHIGNRYCPARKLRAPTQTPAFCGIQQGYRDCQQACEP
jgi:hypothetical protein